MEGSDWVALVAVIITGISIVLTYRGSEKRHKRQLAHERREAMVTTAARAYMGASKLAMTTETHTVQARDRSSGQFWTGVSSPSGQFCLPVRGQNCTDPD